MLHSTTCTINPSLSPHTKATLEKHGLAGTTKKLPSFSSTTSSISSTKSKRDVGCITGKFSKKKLFLFFLSFFSINPNYLKVKIQG